MQIEIKKSSSLILYKMLKAGDVFQIKGYESFYLKLKFGSVNLTTMELSPDFDNDREVIQYDSKLTLERIYP